MLTECGPTKSELLAYFKFMVRKSLDFHILFINKGEIVVKQGRGGKELVERALPLLKDRYNELGYNYQITITEVKPPEQEPPSPIPVNPVSKGDEEPLNIEGESLNGLKPKSLVYNAEPFREWEGLSFRSEQEVRVAKALDSLGVTFGPNTGIRVTEPDRRHTREVDFLVIIDGNVGVLEADSKQYHDAVKDAVRDSIFREKGLKFIKRYSYQECLNAQGVAVDFVSSMKSFFKEESKGFSFVRSDHLLHSFSQIAKSSEGLERCWSCAVKYISNPGVRHVLNDHGTPLFLDQSQVDVGISMLYKSLLISNGVQELEFAVYNAFKLRVKASIHYY